MRFRSILGRFRCASLWWQVLLIPPVVFGALWWTSAVGDWVISPLVFTGIVGLAVAGRELAGLAEAAVASRYANRIRAVSLGELAETAG